MHLFVCNNQQLFKRHQHTRLGDLHSQGVKVGTFCNTMLTQLMVYISSHLEVHSRFQSLKASSVLHIWPGSVTLSLSYNQTVMSTGTKHTKPTATAPDRCSNSYQSFQGPLFKVTKMAAVTGFVSYTTVSTGSLFIYLHLFALSNGNQSEIQRNRTNFLKIRRQTGCWMATHRRCLFKWTVA